MSFLHKIKNVLSSDPNNFAGIAKRQDTNGELTQQTEVNQHKPLKTEVVLIIDKSSSMSELTNSIRAGVSGYIAGNRALPGDCILTLAVFSNDKEYNYYRVDAKEATERFNYLPQGLTSLYDAIGTTMDDILQSQVEEGRERFPDKTMFIIITDGGDLTSKIYNKVTISDKIEKTQRDLGWEFFFLGTGISANASAEALHIPKEHASNFYKDDIGNTAMFLSLLHATTDIRMDNENGMSEEWKKDIALDAANRNLALPGYTET